MGFSHLYTVTINLGSDGTSIVDVGSVRVLWLGRNGKLITLTNQAGGMPWNPTCPGGVLVKPGPNEELICPGHPEYMPGAHRCWEDGNPYD